LEAKINSLPRPKAHKNSLAEFNGGAIGSSRGFFPVNGTLQAVPHKMGRKSMSSPSILHQPKCQGFSEYSAEYHERPFCYSSMDQKPLVLYDPLHYRSRNMAPDLVMPYKNASVVSFDAGLIGRTRKPFETTQKLYHDGQVPSFITNAAIIATQLKQKKAGQSK